MGNFILIICCIIAGMVMPRLRILPNDSYKSVNAWLLYVALPALALRFVPEIEWSAQMILPGISPVIIWICGWLLVTLYARKFNGNLTRITVFEASMPSHITASLLASQYNMNPRLCSLMVGFGLMFVFITTFIWWWVSEWFFI